MKNLERYDRPSFRVWLAAAILGILALYAGYELLGIGVLHWNAVQRETFAMWVEIGSLFLLLFFALSVLRGRMRLLVLVFVTLVFCYLHVVLLPALASLGYLLLLCLLGRRFRSCFALSLPEPFFADLLLGSVGAILLFSLLSLVGLGAIPLLQKVTVVGGLLLLLLEVPWKRPPFPKRQFLLWQGSTMDKKEALVLALIGSMFLMEAGRMNLSLDFDSLWYGVRSEYILDNGGGIYENLGTMGVVYTYSKGLEILTLPLSNLASHSYLAFFGLWFGLITCFAAYRAVCLLTGEGQRSYRLLAPLFLATMPSVMNLSISVKTDSITLMTQAIMLCYLLRYQKQQKATELLLAFAALLFSFLLKPTALLFSSSVFGMALLLFLLRRSFPRWGKSKRSLWLLVPFVGAVIAVAGRTWWLTGVPFTSIFTTVFTKLGFTLRYPFNVESVPYTAASLSVGEKAKRVLLRALQLVFCPIDQADMAHVVCAWGGLVLLWALFLAWIGLQKKEQKATLPAKTFWLWLLLPLSLANLLSFWQLKQIDGNYYNFYYLVVLLAALSFAANRRVANRSLVCLAAPVLALNLILCMVSSSSWQVGMTPIAWKNAGYYPHEQLEKESMVEAGNEKIWSILEKDKRTRLIVIGEHPAMLAFPCNSQSYYDIAGSWGNKNLLRSLESVEAFLNFAKTDYIYMQAGWMTPTSESYLMVLELTEAGVLQDFVFEEGGVLARVCLAEDERLPLEEARKNGERLQEEYRFYVEE